MINPEELDVFVSKVQNAGFIMDITNIHALRKDNHLWYLISYDKLEGDYIINAFDETTNDFFGCPIYSTYDLQEAVQRFGTSHLQSVSVDI